MALCLASVILTHPVIIQLIGLIRKQRCWAGYLHSHLALSQYGSPQQSPGSRVSRAYWLLPSSSTRPKPSNRDPPFALTKTPCSWHLPVPQWGRSFGLNCRGKPICIYHFNSLSYSLSKVTFPSFLVAVPLLFHFPCACIDYYAWSEDALANLTLDTILEDSIPIISD